MSEFFLPPGLKSAIMKLQNIKIDPKQDDLSDSDIEEIAGQIVETEGGCTGGNKMNLDKILTALERGYASGLTSCNGSQEGRWLSVAMKEQLIKLGVIKVDSKGNVISFDKQLAKEILGIDSSDYNKFLSNLSKKSYSEQELEGIPSILLNKYFVGPIIEADSTDEIDKGNYTLRYAMNLKAMHEDYPNVNSLEELKQAIEADMPNSHGVNGEIDEWVGQGGSGDCWLLSAILAMASTEAGRAAIKEAIHPQQDGSVIVEFKGVYDVNGQPVQIRITADEISRFDTDSVSNDRFSNGDNDMLVLELAMNKLEQMIKAGEVIVPTENSTYGTVPGYKAYEDGYHSFLEGSFSSRMIALLTGVDADNYFDNLTNNNIYKLLANAAENPGTILTFGLYGEGHTANTIDGGVYSIDINGGHAFAVTDVTAVRDENGNIDPNKSTVTFVNPWDSTEKITMTWTEFVKLNIGQMSSTSLNGSAEGTAEKPEGSRYYYEKDGKGYAAYSMTDSKKISVDIERFQNGEMNLSQLLAILSNYGEKVTVVAEKQNDGSFQVKISFKDGEDSFESVVTVAGSDDSEVMLIRNNALDSKYANILKAVDAEKAVEVYQNLIAAEGGDVNALTALKNCGLPTQINNAVQQEDGSFKVDVTINGESFTFAFSADKAEALISAGLLEASSPSVSLDSLTAQNYNSYNDMMSAIMLVVGEDNMSKISIHAEKQENGSFKVVISYNDGETSLEATSTIASGDANEVVLIRNNALDSKYANILKAADAEKAVEVYQNLIAAEGGDVNALTALKNCGLPTQINNAVQQEDGSFKVDVTINGESFTFTFDADKEQTLIEAGLVKKEETPKADENDDGVSNTQITYNNANDAHSAISAFIEKNRETLKAYYLSKGGNEYDFNSKIFGAINSYVHSIYTTYPATFSEADIVNKSKECIDSQELTANVNSYMMAVLKNQYHLTDRDIQIFFKNNNGKYEINQNGVKSCFGKEVNSVEELIEAMKGEISIGYVYGAYSMGDDKYLQYLIKVGEGTGNNVKFKLDFAKIEQDFPGQNITTLGQLKDAVDTKGNNNSPKIDNNKDPYVFDTLEEAISKMKLRETYCKGVYCEIHNPNKPAGDYSDQRHYVWDASAHKMIELPGVYFISDNGHEAKGKDGYEQVCAYQQGYNFTDEPGVYEKGGKKYKFNNETGKFEEIKQEQPKKNPKNFKHPKFRLLLDENDLFLK